MDYDKTAEKIAFKSLKEMQDYRTEHYTNALELADGERKMVILPGFDLRNTKDSNYGQASPTLIFAERRGDLAIDCSFYCGWNVFGERATSMDGRDISMMGIGFYYHTRYKKNVKYPEYAHQEKDCALLGHKSCWGNAGSALYGDKLKWVLLNRGSAAIWEEIDMAFKELADGQI